MTKDAIDALAATVPEPVASGRRGTAGAGRHRRPVDRPLGKRGADILSRVPIFAGLNRRHLRRLAELADEVSFRERETFVKEGMLGGTFFVIVEGEAGVVHGGRTIATLRPGEFFGEISLLDGGPRTASVVARTPLVCVRVHKPAFDRLLAQEPTVAKAVLVEVAKRLRELERPLLG